MTIAQMIDERVVEVDPLAEEDESADPDRKSIRKADEAEELPVPPMACSILGVGERTGDVAPRLVLFGLLGVAGLLARRKSERE